MRHAFFLFSADGSGAGRSTLPTALDQAERFTVFAQNDGFTSLIFVPLNYLQLSGFMLQ